MKHQFSNRNALAYALVVLVGLYLLALVSPSLTGGLPLWAVALLASLLPIIVIIWLLVALFGKPKRPPRNTPKGKYYSAVY